MLGFGKKSDTKADGLEKPTRGCSRKKIIIIAAIAFFVIAIALGVGLGVGLTRGNVDNDGDDGSDNGDHPKGSGDNNNLPNGPNRTETWNPKVNDSWQIILKYPVDMTSDADINPDVAIYDLDLFDNSKDTFELLQKAGKKVICYFSAGSYEDWREDKDKWDEADLGKNLDGWEGERWVNVSSPGVHKVMQERINLAWKKGCDAIDPDNVDGYQNANGLGLTKEDAVNYMHFLSEEAGKYNMSTGLKNAGDIIGDVLDVISFSVNEQCIQYGECETFAAFIKAKKPVFNIEYPDSAPKVSTDTKNSICSHKDKAAGSDDFSTVIKKMILDGWVEYCDGNVTETKVQSS